MKGVLTIEYTSEEMGNAAAALIDLAEEADGVFPVEAVMAVLEAGNSRRIAIMVMIRAIMMIMMITKMKMMVINKLK